MSITKVNAGEPCRKPVGSETVIRQRVSVQPAIRAAILERAIELADEFPPIELPDAVARRINVAPSTVMAVLIAWLRAFRSEVTTYREGIDYLRKSGREAREQAFQEVA